MTPSDFSSAFQFDKVSLQEINLFGKLVRTYFNEPEKLQKYYHHAPSITGILEACRTKEKINRSGLVEEITRQYADINISPAVQQNINLLMSENTFCIVTAHQLNVFLGPVYYIHKILSIIKTAEVLNKQGSPYKFVPVFVMGSEDHDKEEVNHTTVYERLFQWDTPQTGAVGRYVIDDSFITLRDNLLDTLQDDELKEAIRTCYALGTQYSVAHRRFLDYLFKDFGLVIMDFDCVYAKEICASVFKDEIINHRAESVLKDTLTDLEQEYEVQAKPRPINIFKLEKGTREYIDDKEKWEDIELQNYSPNVIYRPLMQQKVLPSVCYVGGGGELGYWLELKALFEYNQVQFPVLMLRNHVVYAEKKVKLKMDQWGIVWKDVWKEREVLTNEVIKRTNEFDAVFQQSKTDLEKTFERYKEQALNLDPTLAGAVESEHKRVLAMIEHLEQKFVKGAKRKNETLLNTVDKAKKAIFPQGGLMERNTGFLAYYDQFGKSYFNQILNEMEPFSKEILILQY